MAGWKTRRWGFVTCFATPSWNIRSGRSNRRFRGTSQCFALTRSTVSEIAAKVWLESGTVTVAVWVLGATLSGFLIAFSSFSHVWGRQLLVSDAELFEMEILEEPESERLKTVRRRPVFELGVQTSIRAKVDVLEENAPQGGIEWKNGFTRAD